MEEGKKDCIFQYATGNQIFEDSDLLTIIEAKDLWQKYKSDFIERHNRGEDPEMCIWIDCKNSTDYHSTIWHVSYTTICKDGNIYILTRVDE